MSLRLEWKQQLSEIPREAWDALAVPLETPVLEWEWLRQMEISGSMRPETGWLPCHLTMWSGSDLVAAAPLYIKGHSAGEFVWDYVWADVAGQLGIRYYPKLVGMSPATPVPGYRFLIAPGSDEESLTGLMLERIEELCRANNLSGVSFNYVDPAWKPQLEAVGTFATEVVRRVGHQSTPSTRDAGSQRTPASSCGVPEVRSTRSSSLGF